MGQLLLTRSYKYIDVSTGSIIVMTTPVFNTIAGYVFFRESFSLQMAIGAVIILCSLAGLVLDREKMVRC